MADRPPEKPSLVIIEDHPLVRNRLAAYFTETNRWRVIGAVSSLEQAKELFCTSTADVVIIDIQLEDGWGFEIIPWLMQRSRPHGDHKKPPLPLMAVYSSFDDYAHVSTATGMGVRVYVCKRRSEHELEKILLKAFVEGGDYIDDTTRAKLQTVTGIFDLLTIREMEILNLVKSGLSNKQVAARLGISRRTVENILSCIYDKTGIRSRLELQRL